MRNFDTSLIPYSLYLQTDSTQMERKERLLPCNLKPAWLTEGINLRSYVCSCFIEEEEELRDNRDRVINRSRHVWRQPPSCGWCAGTVLSSISASFMNKGGSFWWGKISLYQHWWVVSIFTRGVDFSLSSDCSVRLRWWSFSDKFRWYSGMTNTVEDSQSEEWKLLVLTCSLQGRGQTS